MRPSSAFILILLLIGWSTLAFDIQPVKAESETIYIRADGNIDPPDTPISSVDNVTYTFSSNITGSIVVERNNTIVDGGGHTLSTEMGDAFALSNMNNVTIQNTRIHNCDGFWIRLSNSSGNTISGNDLSTPGGFECGGLYLFDSSNNTISKNSIRTGVVRAAIYLDSSCFNNISENTISAMHNTGIYLYSSSFNNMLRNSIGGYYADGIILSVSSHNEISENSIDCTWGCSIGLWDSSNNTISRNTCDATFGVELSSSSDNTFYHNNFLGEGAFVSGGAINVWDNGCEGNYWYNYNGTDLHGDGIGDTELPHEGLDNYPLMNPYWNPADVDHDLDVDIYDAVRVLITYGLEQGDPEYNPHCDIAKPYFKIDLYDAVLILMNYGKKYS